MKLFIREMISPINYLLSFLVGATINVFQSGKPFNSLVPFLVPIFVQSFSKASVYLKNRTRDILLLLPQERQDPAFLTAEDGTIIASTGKTKELFLQHNIENIKDLLIIDNTFKDNVIKEAYSTITMKWYSLKVKKVDEIYLIWLEDITDSINLDLRIGIQRQFSIDIMNSLSELVYQNDIYERLAKLILVDDYEGVFLAKLREDNVLEGHAYKHKNGKYEKSGAIEIISDYSAPITFSRQRNSIVTDSIINYAAREEFDKANPFHKDIRDLMDKDIRNYVNYHQNEISIIAFNKFSEITSFDLRTMESAVDNARVVSTLLDMAIENDARFLESMEGLCAAAEFSDEITGKHIYRVNEYSELIARAYGLKEKTCIWLGQVAAIHDIGKVAMPEIIKIDRMYTPEERSTMQMHTIIGSQIITKMIKDAKKPDRRFLLAQKIALNHHQEWCGQGYPGLMDENNQIVDINNINPEYYTRLRPLKEDEVPVEALIVSLADRYDALRSPRHYKKGFSHEKAMEIISFDDRSKRKGEDIFGPMVFDVFLKIHKQMENIYDSMAD